MSMKGSDDVTIGKVWTETQYKVSIETNSTGKRIPADSFYKIQAQHCDQTDKLHSLGLAKMKSAIIDIICSVSERKHTKEK